MHPNYIIVECNEDGFTERDLEAICAVGKSTKAAHHGYIGAKGIGFKSVFIAASRVHIQSGNFSFEFRHNKTDPGIGMVRPIWVNPVETLPSPLTRMTLYLHDQGDEGEIQHLKSIISMQFDELQETCLLFLRKLQQINLEFYDENGELERSKQFRKHEIDKHRVSLETTSILDGEETTKSQIYHLTKHTATGLARSDNRELPDTDDARRSSSTAEVVLAFPLTSDSQPLVTRKKQDLFAFLPLRKSDYKFLIHSDFDTNANRQDIVTTSRRNLNLRGWIATALFQAVLQFCEHPTLCYEWPMFLPSPDDSSDVFWSGLNHEIKELMKNTAVLRSRNRTDLRYINNVFILGSDAKDKNGQPVLDDPVKDLFLSPKYPSAVRDILKSYDLQVMPANRLVDLLEADLRSDDSKMHGEGTTIEWHSTVARMISGWFEKKFLIVKRIKSLPLLPLRDKEFTSTASGPVYFPTTGGIDIPPSLDLRVISLSASKNSDRVTAFRYLGVSEATIDNVRASIFRSLDEKSTFNLGILESYLQYLYLTHQPGKHTKEGYVDVWVQTDRHVYSPSFTDVYLRDSDHPYSPANLLTAQGTAPGLTVRFLGSGHMGHVPAKPNSSHPSWERWLYDFVGIRERLRLLSRDGDSLSDTFLYVFEHRPDKFLGLFEHLWIHEKSNLLRKRALRSEIENLSAKDLCGVNFSLKLRETWLPFNHLLDPVNRYMEHPEQFPFLKFEKSDMTPSLGNRWNFLSDSFSVGKDDSVDFLLEILRSIQRSCPKPSIGQSEKVFDLYIAIYAKLAVAKNGLEARRNVREYFQKQGILDPDEKEPRWTSSSFCLWIAPPDMETCHSLYINFSRRLIDEQMGNIENLFQRTLEIQDASLDDLVDELDHLRDSGCKDKRRMRELYNYLDENIEPTSDMRAAFESSPLIYYETLQGESGWYKISDCLWSSETAIRGKAILDGCWESDENFFVGKLGVKLLTLQMVYDELRQSPRSSTDDIKVAILSLNGLLDTEPIRLDPEPIRKAKIFPVRYPNRTIVLSSVDVDFAIGDRDKLKIRFQDEINLLDFDLDDVRLLKPTFEWLGLQDRYLSKAVRETTSIPSDLGRPISSRNRDLKRKAYFIARVASTFYSPRFVEDQENLYEQLRTMTVMEIDGISSVLEIFQNRKPFRVTVATAHEHIDESSEGQLTIYVPKKRRAQELCFGSVLPRKFAAWLMRPPTGDKDEAVEVEADAVQALTSIFASDQSGLDDILDDQGIVEVGFENEDEGHEDEDEDEDEDENAGEEEDEEQEQEQQQADNLFEADDGSSEQQMTPTHSSVNDSPSPYVGSSDGVPDEGLAETVVGIISRQSHLSHQPRQGGEDNSLRPALFHHSSQPPANPTYRPPQHLQPAMVSQPQIPSFEDTQYRAILNRVIETARTTTFPSRGAFDMSDLRGALSGGARNADDHESFDGLDVISRFRSTNQLERDKKIGAAGELYVFELLSKLQMPSWDLANWQSTIRKYVTIHPDYVNMGAWNSRETADLVYVDTTGHFTDTLIGCGYLDHDEWHGARPKYYIEVKTTTGPCETPFYMSGNQYQLMGRIHRTEARSEVYMIFRVFWVNSERIGLSIYFDPEQLRQDGRLVFTGQTWSVTPGDGREGNA